MTRATGGNGAAARQLWTGWLSIAYAQFYVDTDDEAFSDLDAALAGQVNGLCGAGQGTRLFLTTGRHTGQVELTVEAWTVEPPTDDAWEDVVEAPMEVVGPVRLRSWHGDVFDLSLGDTGSYRVRYSATGMDAADADEHEGDIDDPPTDRYLLQMWPAPPSPDVVRKQTSAIAAYWHRTARALAPPTPRPEPETPEERWRRNRDPEWLAAERVRQDEAWGDPPPTERQRQIEGPVLELVVLDRTLIEALCAAPPIVQRRVARRVAHWLVDRSALAGLSWFRPAVDAMDAGEHRFPDSLGDLSELWSRVSSMPAIPTARSEGLLIRPMAALHAVTAAMNTEPLEAAVGALHQAVLTTGNDWRDVFEAARCVERLIPGGHRLP